MQKNVIILTGGLAGSSVLTSLLYQAGYWVGEDTMKKPDYNTWENSELVRLNRKIIEESGFKDDWVMRFDANYIDKIASGFHKLDTAPFKDFMDECNRHRPWIWKDPRLWLTIRYWRQFFDPNDVVFVTIRREHLQAWISTTLRRQIQTFSHAKKYGDGIDETIQRFLHEEDIDSIRILYENLLLNPESVINDINHAVGVSLGVGDLKKVFRGDLYRRQHGVKNLAKACAIYIKNYGERYR